MAAPLQALSPAGAGQGNRTLLRWVPLGWVPLGWVPLGSGDPLAGDLCADGRAGCGGRFVHDVALVELAGPARELEQRAVGVLEVHRADEHVAVVGVGVVLRLVPALERV